MQLQVQLIRTERLAASRPIAEICSRCRVAESPPSQGSFDSIGIVYDDALPEMLVFGNKGIVDRMWTVDVVACNVVKEHSQCSVIGAVDHGTSRSGCWCADIKSTNGRDRLEALKTLHEIGFLRFGHIGF